MIRLSIDLNHAFTKCNGKNCPVIWLLLAVSVWLVSGCSSVPVVTQSPSQSTVEEAVADYTLALPLQATLSGAPSEAIPALIVAERDASGAGDLSTLSLLWLQDARIVDGRTTVDSTDDYIWQGLPAILDRYQLAVFPNPPPPFEGTPNFDIVRDGSNAHVVNGVDEWRFVRSDGRWWIAELAYQRP